MNKKSIIESILAKGDSLNSREIYDAMEPDEQGFFAGGVDAVGKFLYAMRDKGLIENGISDIVNGRTVLTWKLKDAQISQKTEANETAADIQDVAPLAESDQQETTAAQELEQVCMELPVITETENTDLVDGEVEASTFHDMIENFGAGVNAFIEGTKKLIAEFDEAKAKKPTVIANKAEKVTLLKFMQSFHGKLNEDVDRVLGDIISDLEKLEEAA